MKIRAWPNGSGSGYWRLFHPLKYLNRKYGWTITIDNTKILETQDLLDYDIYMPQGIVDKQGLEALWIAKNEYGKKIIVDFDDYMKVNKDSPHYKEHKVVDAVRVLRKFASVADLVTTTNETLAEALRKINPNVSVIPNYLDLEVWQYPVKRHGTDRVRLGWAGSVTHDRDLKIVIPVLEELLKDFPKLEIVLMGDWRMKKYFGDHPRVEVILGLPFEAYPSKLNGLRLDIGICPLQDNFFCQCKSPIKWMENTIAGAATVASPTVYSSVIREGDNGFLAYNKRDWYQKLAQLIENPELRHNVWNRAYKEVTTDYSLEKNIGKWKRAYESVYNLDRPKNL